MLLIGQAMASMDGSIVSVSAPTIREKLGTSGAVIQLVISGYLLTTGVLLVTCARLGDILGHRRAFLLGLSWFTGASLLCGLAPNAAVLVVARIFQAVGAALLVPQVFSLLQLRYEGAARKRAIGLYSMVLALGVALGQVIGGLVVTANLFGLSWRPAFLINVPIGIALIFAGLRFLPSVESAGRPRLDMVGVAALTLAMTALVAPLIFGRQYGWPAWTWICLALGGCAIVGFAWYERRVRQPLLDLDVLQPAGVKPGLAACLIVMGCYASFVLVLTLHLQSALRFSALEAGLSFVPYPLGFALVSLTWTRYPHWVQSLLPATGPIAFAVAVATLVLISRHGWPSLGSVPLLLVAGAGHAAGYSPLIAQVSALVEVRLSSAMSALNSTGPMLASVTAIAGLGSVYFAAPDTYDGLLRVAMVSAALLVFGAGCALRVRLLTARR